MNQTNLNDLSLKSLYEISLSKWKVITYTVTFFAVTSIIYSLFATPIYRSTAVIEFRDQELPSMESGSSSAAGLASLAGFNLQSKTKETYALEVLKSRKLYEHIFLNYDLKKRSLQQSHMISEKTSWFMIHLFIVKKRRSGQCRPQ